ncbi:MAG: hypothetical protein ACFCUT_10290 [Kiloniellaceae bacterium]
MFNVRIIGGLRASFLALGIAGAVTTVAQAAAQDADNGLVDAAAAQLAARSDVFAASSANLQVLPLKMAGSCPRSFMVKVDLGAQAPGRLAYQIETLDGRLSQIFEADTEAHDDGSFAARAAHEITLRQDDEDSEGFSRIAFSAPTLADDTPAPQPNFFERLFGTAGEGDPSRGLSQQSFRVKVLAPNEVVSAFDQPSVSCEYAEVLRSVREDQRDDGRDRPGDGPGDGPGDRGRGGSSSGGGASGPAGTP